MRVIDLVKLFIDWIKVSIKLWRPCKSDPLSLTKGAVLNCSILPNFKLSVEVLFECNCWELTLLLQCLETLTNFIDWFVRKSNFVIKGRLKNGMLRSSLCNWQHVYHSNYYIVSLLRYSLGYCTASVQYDLKWPYSWQFWH